MLLLSVISNFSFQHVGLAQKSEVVKIGVASMITPVDAVKYYQDVIDYIGEQILMT